MTLIFLAPHDLMRHIAKAAQERRLAINLSQHSLAERSGVSLGALKKFERTGKISLESLLKIALILGALNEFLGLFTQPPPQQPPTLDEILHQKQRKRGRT